MVINSLPDRKRKAQIEIRDLDIVLNNLHSKKEILEREIAELEQSKVEREKKLDLAPSQKKAELSLYISELSKIKKELFTLASNIQSDLQKRKQIHEDIRIEEYRLLGIVNANKHLSIAGETLDNEKKSLTKQVLELQQDRDEAIGELDALKLQLSAIRTDLAVLDSKKEKELSSINKERADLDKERNDLKKLANDLNIYNSRLQKLYQINNLPKFTI